MNLLLNGNVYSPDPIGKAHILLAGGSIVAIFKDEEFDPTRFNGMPWVQVFDLQGSIVAPGLIDLHVHICGGGGEMGPASRTPEANLSELLDGGLTTVIGILGTDCVSRSLESLNAKAKALQQDGITAFMWSGSYRMPPITITGSILRDIQIISEVVGAGEIAISDHRSSWPTTQELLNLVSDARVGGMLSGKAGIVHFHVGSASSCLDPLWCVLNDSKGAIPITQMLPTHISSRGPYLLQKAEVWLQAGGYVDLTADQDGENSTHNALLDWAKRQMPLDNISISSDGFGSLPVFDSEGKLIKYGVASTKANLATMTRLVHEGGWALEDALRVGTKNPAKFLSLSKKGCLEVGRDGDIIVMDLESLELSHVFAMGQLVKSPTWTKKGMFEKNLQRPLRLGRS